MVFHLKVYQHSEICDVLSFVCQKYGMSDGHFERATANGERLPSNGVTSSLSQAETDIGAAGVAVQTTRKMNSEGT